MVGTLKLTLDGFSFGVKFDLKLFQKKLLTCKHLYIYIYFYSMHIFLCLLFILHFGGSSANRDYTYYQTYEEYDLNLPFLQNEDEEVVQNDVQQVQNEEVQNEDEEVNSVSVEVGSIDSVADMSTVSTPPPPPPPPLSAPLLSPATRETVGKFFKVITIYQFSCFKII